MNKFLERFNLHDETEDYQEVVKNIDRDIASRGANLWILIFAIFVASLGLNVNSTAVIIGAMLISPLMGPIMGMGLGMGINDLALLRKSLINYLFAAGVSLATSTVYFAITPINAAHSEILARTSPNIYDVLIAFFGGLAGILAVSCKHRGNVIPGVAIATALMPPLCTAGYGLATLQMTYFFGAFYLFLINTVFIALATLVGIRFLQFPLKTLRDHEAEIRAKRIALVVVLMTLLPSLYFGYDIVKQEKFRQNAARFIQGEAQFQNDYLLEKSIDARQKSITLTYGGKKITDPEIEQLKARSAYYGLENATVNVRQGFVYLNENKPTEPTNPLKQALADKEYELLALKTKTDSLAALEVNTAQLLSEAKALYPELRQVACTELHFPVPLKKGEVEDYLVYLQFSKLPDRKEKKQVQDWLETRLHRKVKVVFGQ